MDVRLNEQRCPADHPCPVARLCPTGAITQQTPFSAPVIDKEKCTNCGRCTAYCPFGAFELTKN